MKCRSGAGARKLTPRDEYRQLGAKLVATSRKLQRQWRWRQTETTGFTTLGKPSNGVKPYPLASNRRYEQSDVKEVAVKLEPATHVGSEPPAAEHRTDPAEQVAAMKPQCACFEDTGGRDSWPQC